MDMVEMKVDAPTALAISYLLQEGFRVYGDVNISVRAVLRNVAGLDDEFIDRRLSTIFLNGKCVDDIDSAIVTDGSVLALSSAMPGLVGSSLRRGGMYRSLRSGVTFRADGEAGTKTTGSVEIRLFNSVIPSLGSLFLERGVVIDRGALLMFLGMRSRLFWEGCRAILVNGKPVMKEDLTDSALWSGNDVTVTVTEVLREPSAAI